MSANRYNGYVSRSIPRVLIVCDNLEVGRIWAHGLRQRRFDAILVDKVKEARRRWEDTIPDLCVLDLYAADQEAVVLGRSLRQESVAPILMFTDRQDESYILEAYNAGMDECVTRPVSPGIFLAKVTAWLRRSWTMPVDGLNGVKVGELHLDPVRRIVETGEGLQIKLTNLEFRLLYVLMTRPGWTVETDVLIERVWGHRQDADNSLLKNVVYRLRRKLETDLDNPSLILTDPGVGYKLHSK